MSLTLQIRILYASRNYNINNWASLIIYNNLSKKTRFLIILLYDNNKIFIKTY